MLPLERQGKILEILAEKKVATVDELCAMLYSSGATIRRDLSILSANRLIHRTHGGAMHLESGGGEFPLTVRESENMLLKEIIAAKALPLIKDGMTVFMDSSSTVSALAAKLNGFNNLRVVTNGIKTCSILSEKDGVEVYCTGGKLRDNAKALGGETALGNIENFNADISLLSCRGITPNGGISDTNESDATIKRAFISHSEKVVLMCDSSKFGKKYFCKICDIGDLWQIISDKEIPKEYL